MNKVTPTWFWATWEHVDNPGRDSLRVWDDWGVQRDGTLNPHLIDLFEVAGMDTAVWSHYRLNGTQDRFVNARGYPIVLGNSILESGFTDRSSCMTCHARATLGEDGSHLATFEDPPLGPPRTEWFSTPDEEHAYLQTDFVWSLIRARPRSPR